MDPLARALSVDKHNYQYIRGFQLPRGGAVIFSHRVLHWGSTVDEDDVPFEALEKPVKRAKTRISLSFAVSDPAFEASYIRDEKSIKEDGGSSSVTRKICVYPELRLRIALACGQLICYYQRFDTPLALLEKMYLAFRSQSDKFTQYYVAKVAAEFAAAVREKVVEDGSGQNKSISSDLSSYEVESDAILESALEAALDAKMSGELDGNFSSLADDFDDGESN